MSNNISVQVNLTGQEVRKIIDVSDGQFQNIRFILLESIMDIITYQCHDMSWLSHRHQFYFSTPWISVSILKEMEIDIVKWVISGLTLEGDSGKEVALWRLTSLSRWSKAKFKSPCNFEELPYVAACVFSSLVIYENVDIVHVFIENYRIRY